MARVAAYARGRRRVVAHGARWLLHTPPPSSSLLCPFYLAAPRTHVPVICSASPRGRSYLLVAVAAADGRATTITPGASRRRSR